MLEIILPAFVVGLLIAVTHASLGIEVLKRGIIFIDLAIAQIAGFGIILAKLVLGIENWFLWQVLAIFIAFLVCGIFVLVEKKCPEILEAVIGVSFVFFACLALLIVSVHVGGAENIVHLLSGEILFVDFSTILHHLPIYLSFFGLWFFCKGKFKTGLGFYLIFTIVIASSVQLVGVYVVFASLIVPAIFVFKMKNDQIIAPVFGVVAICFGILLSVIFDLVAGPMIVISYVGLMVLYYFSRITLHKVKYF